MSELYKEKVDELMSRYREINEENGLPDWAVHKQNHSDKIVLPTVPFVGKDYFNQDVRVLLYASAENLAAYHECNSGEWSEIGGAWLDKDELAENRHRMCFETTEFQNGREYPDAFPHVHLGPMNNGCLATALYYIATEKFGARKFTPRDFYETISFGNYSKFSIETENQRSIRVGNGTTTNKENCDFSSLKTRDAREKLNISIPYLKADIEALKPQVIVVPQSLYWTNYKSFDEISEGMQIIDIYQINRRVINTTIARLYPRKELSQLPEQIRGWYCELHEEGMIEGSSNKNNYLSVFSYLDDKLHQLSI